MSAKELEQLSDEVYVQQINTPTFEKSTPVLQIEEEQNWMTPYLKYLEAGKLPKDKVEAQKIVAKVANYQVGRELYTEEGNPDHG